jgi:hypothetical protein
MVARLSFGTYALLQGMQVRQRIQTPDIHHLLCEAANCRNEFYWCLPVQSRPDESTLAPNKLMEITRT